MPKIIKTKKITNKNYNIPTLYAFSVLKGLVVFIIGMILCAFVILRSPQSNFFFYGAYVFIALGAFWCGYSASKRITGRGIIKGIVASAVYMAIIFILSVILMRFNLSAFVLLLLPVCLIPGAAGGIIATK